MSVPRAAPGPSGSYRTGRAGRAGGPWREVVWSGRRLGGLAVVVGVALRTYRECDGGGLQMALLVVVIDGASGRDLMTAVVCERWSLIVVSAVYNC